MDGGLAAHGGRAGHPLLGGRLDFPVTYWNGQAAIALVAFWPAIALAAERKLHPSFRAVALGGATAMLALWIGTQSKGGGVALVVSAVVVLRGLDARACGCSCPAVVASALAAIAADAHDGAVPRRRETRSTGPSGTPAR